MAFGREIWAVNWGPLPRNFGLWPQSLGLRLHAHVSLFGEPLDGPFPNVERLQGFPRLYTSAAWEDVFPSVERFHEALAFLGPHSRHDGYVDRFDLEAALRRLDIFISPQDLDSLASSPASVDLLQLTLQRISESRRFRSYYAPPKAEARSPSLSGLHRARGSADRRWAGEGVPPGEPGLGFPWAARYRALEA
ncbi:unnamed protein product [Symbiodinium natans]|uniref:Uncharacterized protein n=1 Tax=Symbiodinium natans TaxID=878477 RepID=A0A812JE91_9DINO|nr:unnamed protein product [Symbiodinium natans]